MSEHEKASTAYRLSWRFTLTHVGRVTHVSVALRFFNQWPRGTLTGWFSIGQGMSSLSFNELWCQSIPRGVKRWQMPVLLGPLPVNSAWNGCLISFEWLFSPVQTICYHHVVMRAYIKQRRKGSMHTVVHHNLLIFLNLTMTRRETGTLFVFITETINLHQQWRGTLKYRNILV